MNIDASAVTAIIDAGWLPAILVIIGIYYWKMFPPKQNNVTRPEVDLLAEIRSLNEHLRVITTAVSALAEMREDNKEIGKAVHDLTIRVAELNSRISSK